MRTTICEGFSVGEEEKRGLREGFLYQSGEVDKMRLSKLVASEAKGILEIEKTIRFIKLYYEDHEKEQLMSYLKISENFGILKKALNFQDCCSFTRVKTDRMNIDDRLRNKTKLKKPNVISVP
jgi:hypothetical protein